MAEDAVEALAAAAEFDICTSCDARVTEGRPLQGAITRLQRPDGGCLSVLKVLLSDACHYDCLYARVAPSAASVATPSPPAPSPAPSWT